MFLTERHFKNEDAVKAKITAGHRLGICDSNGSSVKKNGVYIARPKVMSSIARTYVFREGKMVLK